MNIEPVKITIKEPPQAILNKSFIEIAVETMEILEPADPCLKKLLYLNNLAEIPAPFHDYSKHLRKSESVKVMQAALFIYQQHQYDIVSEIFTKLFKDEKNPVKEGRLSSETEITMELLKDKYQLIDISLNKVPKIVDMYSFHLIYRCYEKSFDGIEYSLESDVLIKQIDNTFAYFIRNSEFNSVTK